jgi:hypothetical protein
VDKPITKEVLLRQADGLRDLARRARRLSEIMTLESDQRRLARYVQELEQSAGGLERQAADAKTFFTAPMPAGRVA